MHLFYELEPGSHLRVVRLPALRTQTRQDQLQLHPPAIGEARRVEHRPGALPQTFGDDRRRLEARRNQKPLQGQGRVFQGRRGHLHARADRPHRREPQGPTALLRRDDRRRDLRRGHGVELREPRPDRQPTQLRLEFLGALEFARARRPPRADQTGLLLHARIELRLPVSGVQSETTNSDQVARTAFEEITSGGSATGARAAIGITGCSWKWGRRYSFPRAAAQRTESWLPRPPVMCPDLVAQGPTEHGPWT